MDVITSRQWPSKAHRSNARGGRLLRVLVSAYRRETIMRKLLREAVIFMLLGPVVVGIAALIYLNRQSAVDIKAEAAKAVYAFEAPPLPPGATVDNAVAVPLTNGVQIYVTDCNTLHPWVIESESPAPETLPKNFDFQAEKKAKAAAVSSAVSVAGSTNGSDCVYFFDQYQELAHKYGGRLTAVALGDVNQIAIEKQYWRAYVDAKRTHRVENMIAATFISLWGFVGGVVVWIFYRLVRFAVKG
jgi:hypothetical protein